jgi:hypothetical protein
VRVCVCVFQEDFLLEVKSELSDEV